MSGSVPMPQQLAPIALANVRPIPDGTGRYRVSFGLGEGCRIEANVIAANMADAERKARETIRRCWPQWKEMF